MGPPGEILPQQRLRTMQIIAGTLIAGVLVFLGIAIFLVQRGGHWLGQQPVPMLSYLALAFLAVDLAVWYFLPAQLARQQVRKIADGTWTPGTPESRTAANPGLSSAAFPTDNDKLLAVFQTTSLIGWALLQGVAFFGCIAYLMDGELIALGVVGVAVLVEFVTFPTRDRVLRWLEEQQARIAEIRQAEGITGGRGG